MCAYLPHGLLLKTLTDDTETIGVFSLKKFEIGEIFGPYKGRRVEKLSLNGQDTSYMWEITTDGKLDYYIDGKELEHANWMRFVSSYSSGNNLAAFQSEGNVYYRVSKEIDSGEELVVWYGSDYAVRDGKCEKCEICNKWFASNDMKEHKLLCRSESEKQCGDEAGKPGKDFNGMESHATQEVISAGQLTYVCNACGKGYSRAKFFEKHKLTHFDEKPHKCVECGKGFKDRSVLKTHIRIHTGEKPFICDFCGDKFRQSSNLTKHRRIHTGEKPYTCDFCGDRFSTNSHLTIHRRVHTGEKPYACEYCGKMFSRNDTLSVHKRMHTGEKPYACDLCDKRFSLKIHFNTHRRIHTGEKPYGCDFCEKRFYHMADLGRHRRSHTGEKPYSCDFCGKMFSVNSNLKKHKKLHEKKKT